MYTTHSALSLSLNHHLYEDDTQLFFSFHFHNFDANIAHLQNAMQQISRWMSANRLTLNSSKTEFLIIGLKQQLSKIDNSLLSATHSARNIGVIFDEHLTFSDQISSPSKSCYSHIRELHCIGPYLDSKTASTIAATLNLTTVTLYYDLPKSQMHRLQQMQNCLARTVAEAPKSSHHHPHP